MNHSPRFGHDYSDAFNIDDAEWFLGALTSSQVAAHYVKEQTTPIGPRSRPSGLAES